MFNTEFILRKKRVKLLKKIKESSPIKTIAELTRNVYSSNVSSFLNLRLFEERGLVKTKKVGRSRKIWVTDKGRKVLSNLNMIMRRINLQ